MEYTNGSYKVFKRVQKVENIKRTETTYMKPVQYKYVYIYICTNIQICLQICTNMFIYIYICVYICISCLHEIYFKMEEILKLNIP